MTRAEKRERTRMNDLIENDRVEARRYKGDAVSSMVRIRAR